MDATHATLVKLYTRAADRAAKLTGLTGKARKLADLARSCAIQIERVRCAGMTEEQALVRLADRGSEPP